MAPHAASWGGETAHGRHGSPRDIAVRVRRCRTADAEAQVVDVVGRRLRFGGPGEPDPMAQVLGQARNRGATRSGDPTPSSR